MDSFVRKAGVAAFTVLLTAVVSMVQAGKIAEYTFEPGTVSGIGAGLVIADQATGDGVSNDGTFGAGNASAIVTDAERGSVLSVTQDGGGGMLVGIDCTTKNYTFATWYKGIDGNNGYLLDQQTSRFIMELGQIRVYNGTWGTDLTSYYRSMIENDQWHHIAFVFDNSGGAPGVWSFYLDGVALDLDPVAVGNQTAMALPNAAGIPDLSSSGAQVFFERYTNNMGAMRGSFDDLQVYDHALSASEVTSLYNSQIIIPEPDHRTQILENVTQVAHPTVSYTGHLAVYGPDAFAVGLDRKNSVLDFYEGGYNPIMAGASMGSGRLFCFGTKEWGYFDDNAAAGDMAQLYQNVIFWTSQTDVNDPNAAYDLAIVTDDAGTANWLTVAGYTNVTQRSDWENGLGGADVLIVIMEEEPGSARKTALTNFVTNGGGLIASASGYSWASRGSIGKFDPFSAGANLLFNDIGLGWADKKTPHGTEAWALDIATDAANAWNFNDVYDNQSAYSDTQVNEAAASLLCHREVVTWGDPGCDAIYNRLGSRLTNLVPTPDVPVTDFLECTLLKWEGFLLQDVPVSDIWPHRAALPCDPASPRVSNKMLTINPSPVVHSSMRYDTGLYAPPGEAVTITIPSNLVDAGLRVMVSHLYIYRMHEKNVIPVVPYQMSWFDLDSTINQIGNVHGGLIILYLPASPTPVDGATIKFDGAVEAPIFVLGETTNQEWENSIKGRSGVQFSTLVSDQIALIFENNSLYRNYNDDPETLLKAYHDQIYWMEWLSSYDARDTLAVQMRLHQEYYAAGGVSAFPLSYNINLGTDAVDTDKKYTSTECVVADSQYLTLHEHGHHIQGWTRYANPCPGWGEPSANFSADWVQEKLNMNPSSVFSNVALADTYTNIGDWGGGRSKAFMMADLARTFSGQGMRNITTRFWSLASGPADVWDTEQKRRDLWLTYCADEFGYDLSPWFEQWNLTFTPEAKMSVLGLPKWNKIELIPRSLVVTQNDSITFENPWTSDWSYDGVKEFVSLTPPVNGILANNGDGTYTYTPNSHFTGDDSFDYSIRNSYGNVFTNTVYIKVTEVAASPKLAMGQVIINTSTWTTVTLPNSYASMVVATTPVELPGMPPYVTRIRNASGSSFEILAQRVDGQTGSLAGLVAQYLVAEEGVYTPAAHGIRMEAVKQNSSRTDSAYNFTMDRTLYQNRGNEHYSNPAVFGQVMSYNDPDWSVFWCAAIYREIYAPMGGGMYIGKHVGEDPDTTRADEILGYFVFDTKVPVVHYNDYRLQFDGIGETDAAYLYPTATTYPVRGNGPKVIGGLFGGGGIRGYGASEQGYWPVLAGPEPFAGGDTVSARIAQDHMVNEIENGSRLSSASQDFILLSYFGDNVIANDDVAIAYGEIRTPIDLLGNDAVPYGDGYSVTSVTQGTYGSVINNGDGTVTYVQSSNSTGRDSFSYMVSNGVDSDTATVYIDRRYMTGAPIFNNDPIVRNTTEDTAFSGTIAGEAGDPDGGSVTYSKTAGPAWLSVASDGTLSGTPSTPDAGTNTFTVTAADGSDSTSATLLIEVANTPDAPQFNSDPIWGPPVIFNQAYPYPSLEDYASDPDGDPLSFTKISGPAWLTVHEAGYLTGTPAPGDIGVNEFIVEVSDGDLTARATLLIEVRDVLDGYVGYWPLDEGEGTVAEDASFRDHDGAITGAAWTTGMLGSALDLSGSSSASIMIGDLGDAAYAWSMWAYFPSDITASTSTLGLLQYGGSGTQTVVALGSYSSIAYNETLTIGGNDDGRTYIRDMIAAGWHHLAFSWDSGSNRYRIYMDGVEKTAYAGSHGHTALTQVTNLIYGDTVNFNGFDGYLDDLRIYETSLDSTEINALYNSYFQPQNTPPAFGSNPMDEIDATEGVAYTSVTIADDASDPDAGDTLTFGKISGPAWLSVASNGNLSGTPAAGDIGVNAWTVEVTDGHGPGVWALLKIRVKRPGDITGDEKVNLEDFAFLVSYWLQDCAGDPNCEKANLDTLAGVDMDDLMILAEHWLEGI